MTVCAGVCEREREAAQDGKNEHEREMLVWHVTERKSRKFFL